MKRQESRERVLQTVQTNTDRVKSKYAYEKDVIYSGATLPRRNNSNVVTDNIVRLDPILGVEGVFDIFDVALLSVPDYNQKRVLFIPSATCVQPGSTIATLGYPGTELLDEFQYSNTVDLPISYKNSIPSYSYLKNIFYGFGRLRASVGTILRSYTEKNNQWLEDTDVKYTPHNHYALVSNETVFGGPVVCLDNMNILHKEIDKSGNTWTLVEFVAIHTGGEFVRCIDCLQELPKAREDQKPYTLHACPKCPSLNPTSQTQSMTYNHSISVHHPSFVNMYQTKIVPKIVDLFGRLPQCVQSYVDIHE